MNNIRDDTQGRMRSTGRGGRGCPEPESPSTSATEFSTDASSKESRRYCSPKKVSGEERLRSRSMSSKSRLYPPPPPPPPPPLRVGNNDYMNSVHSSRSRSLDRRQKQRRDDSKSRQQLPRPITVRNISSKESSSSRNSPTHIKAVNGNRTSRSQSRSRSHREVQHHDHQREQDNVKPRQKRSGTPRPSSGRSASRTKDKSSHPLESVDRAGAKSSTSTTNTKDYLTIRSKSPYYAARGKSSERKHFDDISPSSFAGRKSHPSEQVNTTFTTSSRASSSHRGDKRTTTCHSRKILPTSNTAKLDKHGCCIYHPIVQLQRPKSDGSGGWQILSKTCALCIEEARDSERKRNVSPCNQSVNNDRHQLEQDHSKYNTTTAKKRSMFPETPFVSTDASLESLPQDEDEEGCSITLSCLETGDDEPTVSSSGPSSVPIRKGVKSPSPMSRSTAPSSRYPASDSISVSVASQKSHKSHASHKSYTSNRSVTYRENGKASEQTDHVTIDNRDRRSSEPESKKSSKHSASSRRSSSITTRDEVAKKNGAGILHRAEAALRRIKLLENMGDESTTASPSSRKGKSPKVSSEDESSHGYSRTAKSRQARGIDTSSNKGNSTKTSSSEVYPTKRTDHNPYPEPDLPSVVPSIELVTHPQIVTPIPCHSSHDQQTIPQSDDTPDWEPPERNKGWMKYATSVSARDAAEESDGNVKKGNKPKGRTLTNPASNARKMLWKVKQMPYCDQFGDHGIYSGHVNEDGRPDGSGSMKYENGVFYEGTWTDGCQDAAAQYARIRSGFTSWGGKGKSATKSGMVLPWNARKNDAHDVNEKSNVRGMEWIDFKGQSGRYSGEINQDKIPHGNGIMRYDFGLIAEGEWVRGILKEGPHDHLAAAFGSGGQSVVSGMHRIHSSLSLGSRSVGFPSGAISTASGGAMSVFMPPSIVGVQQFMPSQHTVMTHQNGMMSMYGSAVGNVYGGASTVYSGPGMVIPVQQVQYVPTGVQQPPVSSIIIS